MGFTCFVLGVTAEPVVTYSVAAAFVESLHFPSTRLLGQYITECAANACSDVPIAFPLFVGTWKVLGVGGYLALQQRALSDELIRVGAIFPLVSVVSTVAVGMTFFGDTIKHFAASSLVSAAGVVVGIVVLALPGESEIRRLSEAAPPPPVAALVERFDIEPYSDFSAE